MQNEILNPMNWSRQYKFKNKEIVIHYETNEYILCSFKGEGKRFKVDKSEFDV